MTHLGLVAAIQFTNDLGIRLAILAITMYVSQSMHAVGSRFD